LERKKHGMQMENEMGEKAKTRRGLRIKMSVITE